MISSMRDTIDKYINMETQKGFANAASINAGIASMLKKTGYRNGSQLGVVMANAIVITMGINSFSLLCFYRQPPSVKP